MKPSCALWPEKTVDLSDGDEDENILTFDDIEGEKLPDEEAKP
jgi:hypothetical protein